MALKPLKSLPAFAEKKVSMSTAEQQTRPSEIFWFIAQADVLKGPYTADQVTKAIEKKELTFSDFCWRQGFKEWRPISSVKDFDRREKVQSLPSYPSVLPPVNENFQRELATLGTNSRPVQKTIRVSFARSPRQAISIYEWASAVVFAVFFAFLASSFSLREVRRNVLAHLEINDLGRPQTVGNHHESLPTAVWSPLFSAPSLGDVVQMSSERSSLFTSDPIHFSLPVTLSGHGNLSPSPASSGRAPASTQESSLTVAGFGIGNETKLQLWKAEEFDLDPVYSKALLVRGYLSGHDGTKIQIENDGEPYLAP